MLTLASYKLQPCSLVKLFKLLYVLYLCFTYTDCYIVCVRDQVIVKAVYDF